MVRSVGTTRSATVFASARQPGAERRGSLERDHVATPGRCEGEAQAERQDDRTTLQPEQPGEAGAGHPRNGRTDESRNREDDHERGTEHERGLLG